MGYHINETGINSPYKLNVKLIKNKNFYSFEYTMRFHLYHLLLLIISTSFILSCNSTDNDSLPFEKEDFIEVVRPYGPKYHPGIRPRFHKGISFELSENAQIYAMHDGIVSGTQYLNNGFGRRIIISHYDSVAIHYYYLNEIHVSEGEDIKKGQTIGVSGNSGLTTVNGLGVRVVVRDSIVNPEDILPALSDFLKKD